MYALSGNMASTARLFSQMGMHYHVVDRLPLFTKVARLVDRQADFTWYPAATLPDVSIFTHTLGLSMYGNPLGFIFQSQNNSFVLPSMADDQLLPFAANFLELEVGTVAPTGRTACVEKSPAVLLSKSLLPSLFGLAVSAVTDTCSWTCCTPEQTQTISPSP
jgi:hypothetical protein